MEIPHFVVMCSQRFEKNVELFLKSLEINGKLKNFYFTILSNEKVKNSFLRSNADIKIYNYEKVFEKNPWFSCPRWDVEPKSNLYFGIDPDVVAVNDLNPLLKDCNSFQGISGVICYSSPLSLIQWKNLFELFDLNLNEKDLYQLGFQSKPNPSCIGTGALCPYYINNGVVHLSGNLINNFNVDLKKIIYEMSKLSRFRDNHYFSQIAHCLAIEKSKINKRIMPKEFNFLDNYFVDECLPSKNRSLLCYKNKSSSYLNNFKQNLNLKIKKVYFYHYNYSKYRIDSIDDYISYFKNMFLKKF